MSFGDIEKKMTEIEPAIEKNKRMRYNLFMDLFTTESNYVGILKTIVTVSVSQAITHIQRHMWCVCVCCTVDLTHCLPFFMTVIPPTIGKYGRRCGPTIKQIRNTRHFQQLLAHL